MNGLWRWDIDTFRSIHLAGRGLVSDPFLQCITNMGLTHIQAMPLLIAAIRPRVPAWALYLSIGIALSLSYSAEGRGIPGVAAFGVCLILFWKLPARVALGALFACLISGILRIIVEAMVNRERPSNFAFANPLEPVFHFSSFPSGHATTSMAIAVFLLWALNDDSEKPDRVVSYFALGWAGLVGVSRVVAGVHYPLDVLAGFALALASATGFWLLWVKKGWAVEKALTEPDSEDYSDSQ